MPLGPATAAFAPSIAVAGDRMLVVWYDGQLEASLNGSPVWSSGPRNQYPVKAAVTAGKNVFLIVFAADSQLLATRIDFDGHVLDAEPIVVSDGLLLLYRDVDVVYDGTRFLVAWSDVRLETAVVSDEGIVSARRQRVASIYNTAPHLIRLLQRDHEALIVFSLEQLCGCDITAFTPSNVGIIKIADASAVPDPVTLFGDVESGKLHVTADRSGNTVTYAWASWKGRTLWIAQSTIEGALLRSPTFLYQPADSSTYILTPQMAWNGSEYVLVWIESRFAEGNTFTGRVRGIRLDATGHQIDSSPFDISVDLVLADGQFGNESVIATPAGVVVAYERIGDDTEGIPRIFSRTIDRISAQPRRRSARP
ncbi:MAG: hypothetical protein ACXVIJ_00220 [Thermoanaerobaculia bacterium]